MQTLQDVERIADRLTSQLFDKSIHNQAGYSQNEISELADEYLDDDDQVWDVLISEEWAGEVQSTIRAMVNAYLLKNDASFDAFARSIAQSIIDGANKKAEWMLTK